MNKLLLTLIATLLLASQAQAQTSASLGFAIKDVATGTQNHQTALSIKTKVATKLDADVNFTNDAADKSNSVTTRMETGVTYTESIYGPVSGYVRLAVGVKQKSGNEAFEYYSYEPGVRVKLPYDFSAKVAYRHREAFATGKGDTSETMKYSLSYAITKKDSVEFGYDSQKGDGACTVKSLKYTRAF